MFRRRVRNRESGGAPAAVVLATNLLLKSQAFDNAAWTKTAGSFAADALAAPDATTTADTFTDTAANSVHRCFQAVTIANTTVYTVSLYVKAGTMGWCELNGNAGNSRASFNANTGVVGGTTSSTSAIVDAGGGWYRCSMTYTSTLTSEFTVINFGPTEAQAKAGGYVGTGSTISAWGAQLETGASATTYVPTL